MNKPLALITGGAGCIGSELAGALIDRGWRVRIIDNLSSGSWDHIKHLDLEDFIQDSISDSQYSATEDVGMVWHLCAKTDIKFSECYDFCADFAENYAATFRLLEAMRTNGVKRLAFASSAAVYGDATVLDESLMPDPISMYGATKLGCEAMIRAYARRCGIQSWIFRYCSIVSGKARKSGNMVIPDLIHKLKRDPRRLEILGDGNQTKPSLHVSECVEAMLFAIEHATDDVNLFNVGAPDAISVTRQAELICEAMGVNPAFIYTGGAGGWPGDVPSFRMCVEKLAALGWRAKRTSEEAVKLAIQGLLESGE